MAGPRWVRLDVDYFHHPLAVAAGRDGRDLHLASICWAASQLTDGHIPVAVVAVVLRDAGVRRSAVDRAVAAGLWIPKGDGFDVRDYLDRNPSRAEVENERESWRLRQRRRRGNDGRFTTDE